MRFYRASILKVRCCVIILNVITNIIMAIKTYKPFTPSRRYMTGYDFSVLTTNSPHKPLTKFIRSKAWRNNRWRITVRHRWWRHKRLYRTIDFRWYDKFNIPAKVTTIEYDPFRTCHIALLTYTDGEKRYVLAWKNANVWDVVMVWDQALLKPWNRKKLKNIPDWFSIYALEVTPNTKWKLVRSAWSYATITGRDEENGLVYVKLQSWEVRKFHDSCWATIWVVWNDEHKNVVIGKAWRSRRLWRRPVVRGKVMNPVDHPHGWWEWATDLAMNPKSFRWRAVSPGMKTRKKKKRSDKFIVSRRKTRFK